MHLNRLPEAEASLAQALALDPNNIPARANQIVLASLMGQKGTEVQGLREGLRELDEEGNGEAGGGERCALLRDWEQMERRFEEAGGRFRAKAKVGVS